MSPNFNPEFIGYFAAFFTCSCFVPQVLKALREKQTQNLSLVMYVMNGIGVLAWTYYGILVGSPSILLTNVIAMGMVGTIIILKLKHG